MIKRWIFAIAVLTAIVILYCGDSVITERTTGEWLLNRDELYMRGVGKGVTFSLDSPHHLDASRQTYVSENDRVICTLVNGEYIAYPYNILRWYEIVNDYSEDFYYSIIYCPFTAVGTMWQERFESDSITFGTSDLVYNSSHIVFDKITDSYWLPIKNQCIYGELIRQAPVRLRSIETIWQTWEEMYPNSKVLYDRSGYYYGNTNDPYPQYSSNNDLFYFPISYLDTRLDSKEIVHALIEDEFSKVYRIESMPDTMMVYNDQFAGQPIVVAGSRVKKLVVSYGRHTHDNATLTFQPVQEGLPVLMTDNEGNSWDIWGMAVSGPRTGEYLDMVVSFNCYWFAIAATYPELELIEF